MKYAREDKVVGPQISLPEKDEDERWQGGAGRTWPTSRPGAFRGVVAAKAPYHLPYVQMAGN